jgi:hypothetical protein
MSKIEREIQKEKVSDKSKGEKKSIYNRCTILCKVKTRMAIYSCLIMLYIGNAKSCLLFLFFVTCFLTRKEDSQYSFSLSLSFLSSTHQMLRIFSFLVRQLGVSHKYTHKSTTQINIRVREREKERVSEESRQNKS